MLHTLVDTYVTPRGINVEEYSPFVFTALGAGFFFLFQFVAAGLCNLLSPFYRSMEWKDRQQYRMHLVSGLHAALGGWHGVVIFMEDPFVMSPEWMFYPQYMAKAIMAFHLGYFCQDFFVTLFQHKAIGDTATYIHHISVGAAFALCVSQGIAVWMTGSLLANELSGPFLHARWFIRKYNLSGTRLEELNAFFLVSTYAVFRLLLTVYHIGNGAWYQKYMFWGYTPDIPFYKKVCVDLLWIPLILQFIMNSFWFKKVIKFSGPIVAFAEFMGVMRLKNTRVGKRVQDISQHAERTVNDLKTTAGSLKKHTVDTLHKTVEDVRTAGKSGVETFLDSQSEKPKSQRALQLQTAFRFVTWIGGALLFCTDIARRSRTYSQPVEIFSYIIALLMLVLGMFSLFFNNDEAPVSRTKAVRAEATAAKVKVN